MIIDMHKAEATATRVWQVSTHTYVDNTEKSYLLIKHGNMGGKMVERTKPVTMKNIGRANQTTCESQAELEALALARKKMDENYRLTTPTQVMGKEGFEKRVSLLPMLAKSFEQKRLHTTSVIHLQPKLDGIRCIAYLQDGNVLMKTRKGKDITVCSEINSELNKVLAINPTMIFDGEIYYHGWDFSKITSATKKRSTDTALLEYHIFDIINDKPFGERMLKLKHVFLTHRAKDSRIKIVLTERSTSGFKGFIDETHIRYTQAGYEGTMIRVDDCKYIQDKRSSELLKHKDFEDEEFVIVGGARELLQDGNYGVVYEVQDPKNPAVVFSVRPKGTMEQRANELKQLPGVIGLLYKVRYQNKSETFVPRFPSGLGVRTIG